MIRLPQSLAAWNTPDFEIVLKRELEQLGAGQLPLQQALSSNSYALDDALCVMIISAGAAPAFIRAKVGVFFSGITAGCSCPSSRVFARYTGWQARWSDEFVACGNIKMNRLTRFLG